jgi:hypothetical protein
MEPRPNEENEENSASLLSPEWQRRLRKARTDWDSLSDEERKRLKDKATAKTRVLLAATLTALYDHTVAAATHAYEARCDTSMPLVPAGFTQESWREYGRSTLENLARKGVVLPLSIWETTGACIWASLSGEYAGPWTPPSFSEASWSKYRAWVQKSLALGAEVGTVIRDRSPVEVQSVVGAGFNWDTERRGKDLDTLSTTLGSLTMLFYETFPEEVRHALDVMRAAGAVVDAYHAAREGPHSANEESIAWQPNRDEETSAFQAKVHQQRIDDGKTAAPHVERMYAALRGVRSTKDARPIIRLVLQTVDQALSAEQATPEERADHVCKTLKLNLPKPYEVPALADVRETFGTDGRGRVAHTRTIARLVLGQDVTSDDVKKATKPKTPW